MTLLKRRHNREKWQFDYLIGCDGAMSIVRKSLSRTEWPGQTSGMVSTSTTITTSIAELWRSRDSSLAVLLLETKPSSTPINLPSPSPCRQNERWENSPGQRILLALCHPVKGLWRHERRCRCLRPCTILDRVVGGQLRRA